MPKLSIIIPVYNVEKYINRCLDSVLEQRYKDYEIIIVDDGSTDSSATIVDKYKKYKNISVIHQLNHGVSSARNVALKNACGEYVTFVDADDYIDPLIYESMMQFAYKSQADLICCNWKEDKLGRIITNSNIDIPRSMDGDGFIMHLFDQPRTVGSFPWNKVFKKASIKHLFHEELEIGEDLVFLVENAVKMEKICYIPHPLYFWYYRDDSAMRKPDETRYMKSLKARRIIVDFLNQNRKIVQKYAQSDFLDSALLYLNEATNINLKEQIKEYTKEYLKHNICSFLINSQISVKLKYVYIKNFII